MERGVSGLNQKNYKKIPGFFAESLYNAPIETAKEPCVAKSYQGIQGHSLNHSANRRNDSVNDPGVAEISNGDPTINNSEGHSPNCSANRWSDLANNSGIAETTTEHKPTKKN